MPYVIVEADLNVATFDVLAVTVGGRPPSGQTILEVVSMIFRDGDNLVFGPWRLAVRDLEPPGDDDRMRLGAPWPWPMPHALIGRWRGQQDAPPDVAAQNERGRQ